MVVDCDSKEKRIAVEQALREEAKTVGIAYHWPKRLVKPIKTIREAYKAAGEVNLKDTKVDLTHADMRIRPSDDGTRIIVQYREKRNGANSRFDHLETLPVPIIAEERNNHPSHGQSHNNHTKTQTNVLRRSLARNQRQHEKKHPQTNRPIHHQETPHL